MRALLMLLVPAMAFSVQNLSLEFTLNEQADAHSLAMHDLATERAGLQLEAAARSSRWERLRGNPAFPGAQLLQLEHQVKMDVLAKAMLSHREEVLRAKLSSIAALRAARETDFAAANLRSNEAQLAWYRLETERAEKEHEFAVDRHKTLSELSTSGAVAAQSVYDADTESKQRATALEGWRRKLHYQEAQVKEARELRQRLERR